MSQAVIRPTLVFYSRASCEPCIEARQTLQWELEARAARGDIVPLVREVDVDADPAARARYGALVPVVVVGDAELPLMTSGRQLRAFLAASLPRLA
jgi:glutaredoxin